MKRLGWMWLLAVSLCVAVMTQAGAKVIEREEDPAIVAQTLSNTHIEWSGNYIRKDVTAVHPERREKLQVIHSQGSYDLGAFHEGFAQISHIDTNTQADSPLLINSDGSKTTHKHRDTRIILLAYDGSLRLPAWNTDDVGDERCFLAKGTQTLYCNGLVKVSVAHHDYEGVFQEVGHVTVDKS